MTVAAARRRVCLIGGGFAQRYAHAFHAASEADVVAVCTRRPESAAKLAAAVGCTPYTDAHEMLRRGDPRHRRRRHPQ